MTKTFSSFAIKPFLVRKSERSQKWALFRSHVPFAHFLKNMPENFLKFFTGQIFFHL